MSQQLPLPLGFNPEHGFEEYHPGTANAEAVAHLRRAVSGPREPLVYLWGESGLGKTHLLHACCREAHRAGLSVSYLPLAMLRAYGVGVLEELENQEWVCLDDVQAIAGDAEWERAVFRLVNRLRDLGHRLMAGADAPPADLPLHLPDLKTRLAWGLTLMLRPLDDEDKLAALSLRARILGFELPPQVGRFLLGSRQRDLPSLIQLLERLDRATLAAKRKLTIPFLKAYLEANP